MNLKVEALLWVEMVEAGIVPFDNAAIKSSFEKRFEGLSEDDARRLKRKFRKLWRKTRFGVGFRRGEPDRQTMRRRKLDVWRSFIRKIWAEVRRNEEPYSPFD